jgi:hypothetical protein
LAPIQLIESVMFTGIGILIYYAHITYNINIGLYNIIVYFVTRMYLSSYRHSTSNFYKQWVGFICGILYLYFYPTNLIYTSFNEQTTSFIKSNALYYGIIPAFIYGFHYKLVGYWYNEPNETIDKLNEIRNLFMNKFKTNIVSSVFILVYDWFNDLYIFDKTNIHCIYSDDDLIGYILFEHDYIKHVFIHPNYQGNKIYDNINSYFIEYMKINKYTHLSCFTTSYTTFYKRMVSNMNFEYNKHVYTISIFSVKLCFLKLPLSFFECITKEHRNNHIHCRTFQTEQNNLRTH